MSALATSPIESLVLRPGAPSDWNFVRKNWIRSYATSPFARAMTAREEWMTGRTAKVYWAGHHSVIDAILKRASLTVASWPEDLDTIVGFAVTEGDDLVHYVFVMSGDNGVYRRCGIAKRLLASFRDRVRVRYSHRSAICNHLPIPGNWVYDPYAAWGLEPT